MCRNNKIETSIPVFFSQPLIDPKVRRTMWLFYTNNAVAVRASTYTQFLLGVTSGIFIYGNIFVTEHP